VSAAAFVEEGIIRVVRGPVANVWRLYEDSVRLWRLEPIKSHDARVFACDRERLLDEARD
jgi:hypothetical protein